MISSHTFVIMVILCGISLPCLQLAASQAKSQTRKTDINSQEINESIHEWDPNGYVFFCLCMGRFGNQAEHFLGGLAFAKSLNRTLVLPPWRTYRNVKFTEWFQLTPLQQYHRVIVAEDFMKHLAPEHWPPRHHVGFCWLPEGSTAKCKMKDGEPFGPFWDGLKVDFVNYEIYHFSFTDVAKWKSVYPPHKYPVLALRGAPATFPMQRHHWPLQALLQWSDTVLQMADKYIQENFPGEKFVGIHLRNGPDWENGCKDVGETENYMASPQCLHGTGRKVTKKMCLPPLPEVLRLTKDAVLNVGAKVVYVATDRRPLIQELTDHLSAQKVKVFHADPWLPQADLAVLQKADVFIGNCVSSFTSFVKRARDVEHKPTLFWGFS